MSIIKKIGKFIKSLERDQTPITCEESERRAQVIKDNKADDMLIITTLVAPAIGVPILIAKEIKEAKKAKKEIE